MDQRKKITKAMWFAAALFGLLVGAPLYADCHKHGEKAATKEGMSTQKDVCESTAKEACLFKAGDLLGSDVKARASTAMSTEQHSSPATEKNPGAVRRSEPGPVAEKIGTVGDLVICDNARKVVYVVVASQGKYYPVPWWAFDVRNSRLSPHASGSYVLEPADAGRYGQGWLSSGMWTSESSGAARRPVLFLSITREQLRQAPTIASTIPLEKLSDLKLYQEIDSFYSRHAGREAGQMATAPMGPPRLLKVSQIRGLKLQDSHSANLGKIQDLLVDSRGGDLAYGLVRFGGFMGVAQKTAAVPWSALSIRTEQGYAALNGGRDKLEAAVINEGNLEKLAQPEFARRIYDTFGASPYWEVFGFVPGEEAKGSMNPWLPDSSYNKGFDSSKLTTIEGTIKDVSVFYPDGGAAPGTRLDVKTKDGESVTVDAGPRAFAAQNAIEFKLDSKISVTGSRTKVDGESVIMASEIRLDGKTLKLRDSQGKPEWKIEDLPPED